MIKLPTAPSKPARQARDYIELFYGPPGVGKTTFVNSFGRVLFISTDRGTRFQSAMRVESHRWEDFLEIVDALKTNKAHEKYDYICVDHIDDWVNQCEEETCISLDIDALGEEAHGKGWKRFKDQMRWGLNALLGMSSGLVFIAHEKIVTVKSRGMELQRVMPSMSKSAWDYIVPAADIIGYCGFRRVGKGDEKKEIRVLETVPREDLYLKDRTDRNKPDQKGTSYELLDGEQFIRTFTQASDSRRPGTESVGTNHGTTNSGTADGDAPRSKGRRARAQ